MFLIDDLLLSPVNGLLWVFRELHDVVQQERDGEGEAVTRELSELYQRLESGAITEDQFTAEETRLLDRLDAIEARNGTADDEEQDEDQDEDSGDEEAVESEDPDGSTVAEDAQEGAAEDTSAP